MADISKLEQQESFADEYGDRIAEWELFAVALICKELGRIGKMTPEQAKKHDAENETKKTEKIILSALTTAVLLNIKDLPKTYTGLFDEWHKGNEYMYKYRGVPFVDVADNKGLQKIIKSYSKKSGAEFLDFTKTKAIKVLDANGKPVAFREQILKSFKEATDLVTSGKQDFYTTMRKTVLDLGSSGARVEYPNGMTRRLDTVVRQNMLYNAKMSSREYNKQIGKELGTDGIEIDLHANSRPSHRFMEGRQYAKGHTVTINGVEYEGAIDKGVYDRLYVDYNCQHYETDIILGVSEPRYSPEELARLKAENERQFTIGKSTGDGYYWSQRMRHLEAETRNAKDQINALKAFGNSETQIADLNKKIKAYRQKYNEISEITGIQGDKKRMSVPRGTASIKSATPTPTKTLKTDTKIKGTNISIDKGVSASKVDDEIFEKSTKQIENLESKFNIGKSNNVSFGTKNMRNADGFVEYNPRNMKSQKINICEGQNKSVDDVVSKQISRKNNGQIMPFADENASVYSVTHEYGHALQNSVVEKRIDWGSLKTKEDKLWETMSSKATTPEQATKLKQNADGIYTREIAKRKREINNEIFEEARKIDSSFDVQKYASKYGLTNESELFAEAFANSQLGELNVLGQAMNKWLERQGF